MASTVLTVSTVPLQEDNSLSEDDQFMDMSRQIAGFFVDMYLNEEYRAQIDILPRRPDDSRGKALPLSRNEEDVSAEGGNEIAIEVARRLRELGDKINDQIKAELDQTFKELYRERSVWEIGYGQFQMVCRGILSTCQGALQTGWEQMSVVYIVTSRLVDELRHQQGARGGLRETQMQGFPGNFMRDSGLQEWIDQQGGVDHVCNTPAGQQKADIKESEV